MINISQQYQTIESQYLVYANRQCKQRNTRAMRVSGFLNNIDIMPSNYQQTTQIMTKNNQSLPNINISKIKLEPLQLSLARKSHILTDPIIPQPREEYQNQDNNKSSIKVNEIKRTIKLSKLPRKQVVFRNSVIIVNPTDGTMRNENIDGQKKPIRRLMHKKSQTLCK